MNREQAFVKAVASLRVDTVDVASAIGRLEDWLATLEAGLAGTSLSSAGLRRGDPSFTDSSCTDPSCTDPSSSDPSARKSSAGDPARVDTSMAAQVDGVLAGLRASQAAWTARWAALQPARTLAARFDDKAMLLVFGKFNAGKSSLCNFLAERFAAHGGPVRWFRLDDGRVLDSAERFREGATETTAVLQGVILAERLVLLDTPGLHSVTGDNAELTRRFTDSADGLLWLTSSASPGQVQELDELARELHRDKPLLPVLTRSDTIEEDEIDGELHRVLCNKSADNRRLQEDDVQRRAAERLAQMGIDTGLLRPPLSVSVAVARERGQTAPALADAGFERLYAALLALIGPALAHKQRKPAAVLIHHLQENVLGLLDDRIAPLLDALEGRLRDERDRLDGQAQALAQSVWRAVVPRLPALLEANEANEATETRDPSAGDDPGREVSRWIDAALADAMQRLLADYRLDPAPPARIDWKAEHFVEGPAGHEQRYLALEAGVEAALQETARIVEPCIARVNRLSTDLAAIRTLIAGQRQALADCHAALWRDPDGQRPAPSTLRILSLEETDP